jgi:ribonuclease P/MRP protein subunit POP5
LDGKQVYNALRDSVTTNFGDAGWGAVGMSLTGALILTIVTLRFQPTILHFALVKYFSPTTNLCIIRVARDHHRIAWGAVTLLTGIDDVRVIPHVVHVSGRLCISYRACDVIL